MRADRMGTGTTATRRDAEAVPSRYSGEIVRGRNTGVTLRIGATSPTGTPAGSLGWADRQGILAENLKDAGVDKIEYSFFQSGSDVASALFAGAVDVAAIGDNPALRARSRNPKVVLLALDSISSDAWLVGAEDGPTDIQGLVGKSVTAPQGTIRDRAAKQLIDATGLTGKIQVCDVPTPESIAGLSSGQIDATVVTGASAIELAHRGFPIIDSLSRHSLGSTGTNIALSTLTDYRKRVGWGRGRTSGARLDRSPLLKAVPPLMESRLPTPAALAVSPWNHPPTSGDDGQ